MLMKWELTKWELGIEEVESGQNYMVPLGVMKQLSICLHSKPLSHPSIAAGFRGFQNCLKIEKRLTSGKSGLEQPVRRTSFYCTRGKMIKTALLNLQQLEKLCEAETIYTD